MGFWGLYNFLSFEHSGCTPYSVGSRLIPPRWQRIALLWSPPAHFAYSACPTLACFHPPGGGFEGGFSLLQISDSLPHCALTALRLLTLRRVKKSGGVFHELPILVYKLQFEVKFSAMPQKGKSTNKRSRTFSRTRTAIEGAWRLITSDVTSNITAGFFVLLLLSSSLALGVLLLRLESVVSSLVFFFPLARRRFWHRKVYCFTIVMAAEINSKYKKFRSSALLATVRARAHVCVSGFYRFLKLVSYFDMHWCILQTIVMLLWKSLWRSFVSGGFLRSQSHQLRLRSCDLVLLKIVLEGVVRTR